MRRVLRKLNMPPGQKLYNMSLHSIRSFFNSGNTLSYTFRKAQLEKLYTVIEAAEDEISRALWSDLRKSATEAYLTETGLLKSEIRLAIRKLKKWMRPESARTNLLNLPSRSKIYKQPLGVVFIIAPWNYPFQLSLMPLIGAMAAGNCAVLKPSESAPASAALIARLISENFPEEYIRVVEGDGAIVVPDLIQHFRFDHIFYTGSPNVGKAVYKIAAEQLVAVTLELGGKSPVVVEADADIATTARRICMSKFSNAGQMCVAPDYILADETIVLSLLDAMKKCIADFFGEDPEVSPDYGRIINEKRFNTLNGFLKEGCIITGGKTNAETRYIAPTIITDIQPESAIMQEEIFGPILPVLMYKNETELRTILSANPDPLAFYIFTRNMSNAKRLINTFSFGGGCVNNTALHLLNPHLPFGGIRNSGMGAYHGKYSFETFTHQKAVMYTPTWFDPNLKYPPFGKKLSILKKIIG